MGDAFNHGKSILKTAGNVIPPESQFVAHRGLMYWWFGRRKVVPILSHDLELLTAAHLTFDSKLQGEEQYPLTLWAIDNIQDMVCSGAGRDKMKDTSNLNPVDGA